MHCKILLFTEKLPSEEEISKKLDPFWEMKEGHECFDWDWWMIGGRYCGAIKSEVDIFDYIDGQKFTRCENINNKLIISDILNDLKEYEGGDIAEWSYFNYFLDENDCFKCDGAYVKNIQNENAFNCFGFIDLDGKGHARERWEGEKWVEDPDFDEKLRKERLRAMENFVTVIDIHS